MFSLSLIYRLYLSHENLQNLSVYDRILLHNDVRIKN